MSDKTDDSLDPNAARGDAPARLDRARALAEEFARTFGYPEPERARLAGPPIEGPLVINRDGTRVEVYRWLGHGRGATSIQVELSLRDDDATVYGTVGDRGLGPWKPSHR